MLVFALTRLNRQYRAEASALELSHTESPELAMHPRLQVLVFVDTVDLAEIEALRYGNGLHADDLTAVHFVVEPDHAARLQERGAPFPHETPLRVIDCPDRRGVHDLVAEVLSEHPGTRVTVLLPRRTYSPLLGRLLHDGTADKMARSVSRVRGATAIIMPYDIKSRIARAAAPGSREVGHVKEPISTLAGD